MADPLDVLRTSAARLRSLVEALDSSKLDMPAYPSEWAIADVLSHLGSAAQILQRRLDDTLAGSPTPGDFAQTIWDAWSAKPAQAKAADALAADEALLHRLGSLTEAEQAGFRFTMGPMSFDLAGFMQLRLNELALHTWDIEVALDPDATLAPEATPLIVDSLEPVARFTGKPTGVEHEVAVRTSEPRRDFTVTLGTDAVSLAPAEPVREPDLELPAEAFVRLVYGRLDPDHTPSTRGGDLDELRRAFPGL